MKPAAVYANFWKHLADGPNYCVFIIAEYAGQIRA